MQQLRAALRYLVLGICEPPAQCSLAPSTCTQRSGLCLARSTLCVLPGPRVVGRGLSLFRWSARHCCLQQGDPHLVLSLFVVWGNSRVVPRALPHRATQQQAIINAKRTHTGDADTWQEATATQQKPHKHILELICRGSFSQGQCVGSDGNATQTNKHRTSARADAREQGTMGASRPCIPERGAVGLWAGWHFALLRVFL